MDDYTAILLRLPKDTDYKVALSLAGARLHGSKQTKNEYIIELIKEGLKHEKRNAEKP